MKYHVGDKVKVREDLEIGVYYGDVRFTITMGKFKGKTVTISAAHEDAHSLYLVNEDEEFCKWTDEMFESLAEYTYKDLCNAPVGTKITFENGAVFVKNGRSIFHGSYKSYLENEHLERLKDNYYTNSGRIIKIEEPQYTTVYEAKEILDEKEREYLSNVIKSFKDRIQSIIKYEAGDKYEYISFHSVKSADGFTLPLFQKDAMYRGMEVGREYSLKELGLE